MGLVGELGLLRQQLASFLEEDKVFTGGGFTGLALVFTLFTEAAFAVAALSFGGFLGRFPLGTLRPRSAKFKRTTF
jgi:hypothetical protein